MIREIKYRGITAEPSDYECPDGELDAALNLVPEDGELEPVEGGEIKDALDVNEELLFVHVINSGTKHLIIRKGTSLYYREFGSNELTLIKTYGTNAFKVSATGNMLCVYNTGSIEHYLYIYGEYRGITPDKYVVSILFGVDKTIRQEAKNITGILVNGGGEVYRWNNLYTGSLQKRGTKGLDIYIELQAGVNYRFRLQPSNGAMAYLSLTLHGKDGTSEVRHCDTTQYFAFTPEHDISSIHVAFYSTSEYQGLSSSTYYCDITIDEADEVISGNQVEHAYNPEDTVNEALSSIANKLLSDIRGDNKFALPFFLRYGFRLITGDIITVSPPILIEPSTGVVPVVTLNNLQPTQTGHFNSADATAYANASTLKYMVRDVDKINSIANDDMIESLVIAVSEPIYMYKEGATKNDFQEDVYVNNTKGENRIYAINGVSELGPAVQPKYYLTLPSRKSYERLVESVSQFRILTEIPKFDISTSQEFSDVPIDEGKLAGLQGSVDIIDDNPEQLNSYDAKHVFSYNQREHMFGVKEEIFGGYDLDVMCGFVIGAEHPANYDIGYKQQESSGVQYFTKGMRNESSINRRWFYYPNEKAIQARVYENGKEYDLELKKHDFLTGSFKFGGFGEGSYNSQDVNKNSTRLSNDMPNMMYVSAQDNPLVIQQRLRVGDGILLGGAANTEPISRGQYGQAPLYVFATDGVWGMELTQENKYISRQAVSRDVCIDINSVTPIDKSVLFITDRGIMLLSGSESICITDSIMSDDVMTADDVLPGLDRLIYDYPSVEKARSIVPFREFMQAARMLHDYTHQRIIVYNPALPYAYIYSLKSKLWGMMESNIKYGINSYPECMAVDGENNIVNLSGTSDADASGAVAPVRGLLITRPLKLEQPDMLKTIDTMIQRGKFERGHVQTILYGSRDLFNWQLVSSSVDHYLRGWRGTPYKYFRIVLITELNKGESIFGCTIGYTPRLTDKIR